MQFGLRTSCVRRLAGQGCGSMIRPVTGGPRSNRPGKDTRCSGGNIPPGHRSYSRTATCLQYGSAPVVRCTMLVKTLHSMAVELVRDTSHHLANKLRTKLAGPYLVLELLRIKLVGQRTIGMVHITAVRPRNMPRIDRDVIADGGPAFTPFIMRAVPAQHAHGIRSHTRAEAGHYFRY
ncbi:hypothetical protein J3T99_06000 [Acetobacteraceae bacterium B3987]|nr:hypothetical protein [Acetobacteraceae bacterium B3987]